jgi:hypothetical protein
LLFPESPAKLQGSNCAIVEEPFLLMEEEEGVVRGGFILKHQDFWLGSDAASVAHFRLPLSEGIVNRKFAGVGLQLVRQALSRQPLLFALGMGGRQQPLPRLLDAMRWQLWEVPFYFFANRPFRFLRGIRALRSQAWRRWALDAAAFTGLGWLAARIGRGVVSTGPIQDSTVDEIQRFSNWSDELWERCKANYQFLAVRDSATLNGLYPEGDSRFFRRRVSRSNQPVGWFVAMDTTMKEHKQFGNLRVGTIADSLARPEDAGIVIHAAAKFLRARGVDLIVSNQMHPAWGKALRSTGFFPGPSNFVLAVSPQLKEHCGDGSGIHMNRGDGDGPIHL